MTNDPGHGGSSERDYAACDFDHEGEEIRRESDPRTERTSVPPADEQDDFLDFEPGEREPARASYPPNLLSLYRRWFAGRADVYARQWYDARTDRAGYWPVREPLTDSVVEEHLRGRITVGQYVLHPDCTVSFAALDLDPTAEALEQLRLSSDPEGPLGHRPLVEYATRIRAVAVEAGLSPALEDTGGVGLHLWFFFEPRIPAEKARGMLGELLWRAGAQPPSVSVEIFPKQERLKGKGLGNLIKLPLGIHQATGRASCFLDERLEPLSLEESLYRLRASDPSAVERLARRTVVPFPAGEAANRPHQPEPEPPLELPRGPDPRALAEALARIEPGKPAQAAADRILHGCSVLRELARRAHEERRLSPDEARVLLYSVGLVGRENERIESMFAQAGVSRKELERVRRGFQSPVGCRRLRELFPELSGGCVCPEPPEGGYATPALFAFAKPPRLRRSHEPVAELSLGELPESTSLRRLEERLERIEKAIAAFLERRLFSPEGRGVTGDGEDNP